MIRSIRRIRRVMLSLSLIGSFAAAFDYNAAPVIHGASAPAHQCKGHRRRHRHFWI